MKKTSFITTKLGLLSCAILSPTLLSANDKVSTSEQITGVSQIEQHADYTACIMDRVSKAEVDITVATIRQSCFEIVSAALERSTNKSPTDDTEVMVIVSSQSKDEIIDSMSPIEQRFARENQVKENRFAILPHKQNYLLPITFNDNPDPTLANITNGDAEIDNLEIKFQVSFKTPVWDEPFGEDSALYFAYTGQSYWQAYNSDISSPFRETNHEPEIFASWATDVELGDWKMPVFTLGVVHQSNGRSNLASRSWNRVYSVFAFEKDNWVLGIKPWVRLPESDKEYVGDPSGDDNPDIDDYLGYFEAFTAYKWDDHNIIAMFRNSLQSKNRGAFQLDWSFPLGSDGKLRGYVQYFNGYGESLIDYNRNTNRLGIGFLLTDWL